MMNLTSVREAKWGQEWRSSSWFIVAAMAMALFTGESRVSIDHCALTNMFQSTPRHIPIYFPRPDSTLCG
jgi:hypothetical protein